MLFLRHVLKFWYNRFSYSPQYQVSYIKIFELLSEYYMYIVVTLANSKLFFKYFLQQIAGGGG